MRIDARSPGFSGVWWCWHAEEMRVLKDVVWVDDQSNRWGELVRPIRFDPSTKDVLMSEHQAKQILIKPNRNLVIVNPIEDDDEARVDRAVNVLTSDEVQGSSTVSRLPVFETGLSLDWARTGARPMAGITLEQAEAQLALYLEAEAAVLAKQSYTINGRSLTKANLAEIQEGITLWDTRCKSLDAATRPGGRSRTVIVAG